MRTSHNTNPNPPAAITPIIEAHGVEAGAAAPAGEASTSPRISFRGDMPLDDFIREQGPQAVAQVVSVCERLSAVADAANVPDLRQALQREVVDPLSDLRAPHVGVRLGYQKLALETLLRRLEGPGVDGERRAEVLKKLEQRLRLPGVDVASTILKASRFSLSHPLSAWLKERATCKRQGAILNFAIRAPIAVGRSQHDVVGYANALSQRLEVPEMVHHPRLPRGMAVSDDMANRCFLAMETAADKIPKIAQEMAAFHLPLLPAPVSGNLRSLDVSDVDQLERLAEALYADPLGDVVAKGIELVGPQDGRHFSADPSTLAYHYWQILKGLGEGGEEVPEMLWQGQDEAGKPMRIVQVDDAFVVSIVDAGPDQRVRGISERDADQLEQSVGFASLPPKTRELITDALRRSIAPTPSREARELRWQ